MRYLLAGFAMLAWIGTATAAETVRLKGSEAPTTKLKGSTDTDAETIAVCHRHCGWCCNWCQPVVVSSGCSGCFGGMGGGYSMAAPSSYGLGGSDYASAPYVPTPSYAYAPRSRSYYSAPAQVYTPPAPSYYDLPQTRAVVTLPRLGLSFTIGGNNGLLASRGAPANRIVPPPPPQFEDAPISPPNPGRPDQYRYDGGPSNPIPMPGEPTSPTPTLNNRVKAVPTMARGYLAYGERPVTTTRPDAKANTNLVRNR